MAQNLGWCDKAMMNLLGVRATDAARRHTEKHFAGANFRNGDLFNDHAPLAAVNAGAHLAAIAVPRLARSNLCDCMAHTASASALASSGKGPNASCRI